MLYVNSGSAIGNMCRDLDGACDPSEADSGNRVSSGHSTIRPPYYGPQIVWPFLSPTQRTPEPLERYPGTTVNSAT